MSRPKIAVVIVVLVLMATVGIVGLADAFCSR
jgi:hypothetical protein